MKTISFDKLQEVQEKTRKQPKTITVGGLDIEIKQYLHIGKKIQILMNSMLSTSDDVSFDRHLFELSLKTKLVESYANIELSDSVLASYDAIKETGILEAVLKTIPQEEKTEIEELKLLYIQSQEEEKKAKSSFSHVINTIAQNMPSGEQLEALMGAFGTEE